MRKEYLDILSKADRLEIFVNYEASFDVEDDESIDTDCINYYVKDNSIVTWDDELIMDLEAIDDSNWDESIADEDSLENSWFDCLIINIIREVYEENLDGSRTIDDWADTDITIGALLKDEDDNIIEEVDKLLLSDIL